MFEIIPGILEKKWEEIEKKIELVRPYVKTIHIDILDGKFAKNTTFFDPTPFKKYTKDLFFELHMMIEEPINYLKPWAKAGFKRFLGHVEKMSSQQEFIAQGKRWGEVGLALDGPTSVDKIKVPLNSLDAILVYTGERAGFSGVPMASSRLDKIKALASQTNVPIGIDGGVNDKTIIEARKAGASRFATTGFIFGARDVQVAINKLKTALVLLYYEHE